MIDTQSDMYTQLSSHDDIIRHTLQQETTFMIANNTATTTHGD